MKFKTFSALRHRNFRLFFFGQSVSLIGTWMHSTAQGWLVLTLTDSAFYLSLVNAMGYWPLLFLSPFGGVAADRFSKRGMLLVTQSLSMALALMLALLVSSEAVEVWHVAFIAMGLGLVNTFDIPSRQAFIVEMVGKPELMNGIALNAALFHGSRIIGPAVAGLLIGAVGMAACFYVNALSYTAIIAGLFMMRIEPPEVRREPRPVLKELKEGLAYVRSTTVVRSFIMMVSVSSLLVIPYIALMPIFARDVLHIGATGLGILMGSAGVGALTGALALATFGPVNRKGEVAFISAGVFCIAVLGFALSRNAVLSCLLLAGAGCSMITQMATVNTLIQTDVPDELRGRVMSIYTAVFLGFIPIGNLVVGAVATRIGAPSAIASGSILSLVLLGTILLRDRSLLKC